MVINLMNLKSQMESILHDNVKGIELIRKSKVLRIEPGDIAWNFLVKKGPKSYAIYTTYISNEYGWEKGAEMFDDYTSYSRALKSWDKSY